MVRTSSKKPAGAATKRRMKVVRDANYEERLQAAIEGKKSGRYKTWAAAAKAHQVAVQTMRDRAFGWHKPFQEAHVKQQILTPIQESIVSDWIKHQAAAAIPPHPSGLRQTVFNMTGIYPGKHWHRRYQTRQQHQGLILAKPTGLDPKRAKNFNRAVTTDYFDKRRTLHDMMGGIPPENEWNVDEKGIQLGGGRKGDRRKFFYFQSLRNRYRIRSDNLELVTIIECISAAGDSMPPGFILSEGPIPALEDTPEIGCLCTSPSGWIDNELFHMWFEQVFVPNALKRRIPDKPIILTLDGHGSHETPELQQIAYDNDIIIFCLPSKTTHKLQPLDVAVFAVVQNAWYSHCDKSLMAGIKMDRYNVIQEYMKTRSVVTSTLIKKAFEKSGIYPFNPDIFDNDDFAPSIVSSIVAIFPPSFPESSASSSSQPAASAPLASTSQHSTSLPHDEEGDEGDESDTGLPSPEVMVIYPRNPGLFALTPAPSPSQPLSRQASDIPFGASALTPAPSDRVSGQRDASENVQDSEPRPINEVLAGRLPDPQVIPEGGDLSIAYRNLMKELFTLQNVVKQKDDEIDRERRRADEAEKQARYTNKKIEKEYEKSDQLNDKLQESLAHCSMARSETSSLREQLDNQTKKASRQSASVKVKARFLTHPAHKELFKEKRAQDVEKKRLEDERLAQKAIDDAARSAQILEDTVSKTFDKPLSAYKKKADLVALAGALRLPTEGTIPELVARIKAHLQENSSLATSARFSGLFTGSFKQPQVETGTAGVAPVAMPVNTSQQFDFRPSSAPTTSRVSQAESGYSTQLSVHGAGSLSESVPSSSSLAPSTSMWMPPPPNQPSLSSWAGSQMPLDACYSTFPHIQVASSSSQAAGQQAFYQTRSSNSRFSQWLPGAPGGQFSK